MEVVAEDIRKIIERADTMADMENFENDVPLSDQDIDSLDMANIFLLIEEQYGLKINDQDSKGLNTVNALVEYLNGVQA